METGHFAPRASFRRPGSTGQDTSNVTRLGLHRQPDDPGCDAATRHRPGFPAAALPPSDLPPSAAIADELNAMAAERRWQRIEIIATACAAAAFGSAMTLLWIG